VFCCIRGRCSGWLSALVVGADFVALQVTPQLGHADLALSACHLVAALADVSSVALFARRPGPPGSPRLCALLPSSSSRRRPGPFAAAAAAAAFDSNEEVCGGDGGSNGGAGSGNSAADDLLVVDLDAARTRSLMDAAAGAGSRSVALADAASTTVVGNRAPGVAVSVLNVSCWKGLQAVVVSVGGNPGVWEVFKDSPQRHPSLRMTKLFGMMISRSPVLCLALAFV
jgi:hypothetical protein